MAKVDEYLSEAIRDAGNRATEIMLEQAEKIQDLKVQLDKCKGQLDECAVSTVEISSVQQLAIDVAVYFRTMEIGGVPKDVIENLLWSYQQHRLEQERS